MLSSEQPFAKPRRAAWSDLTRSPHLRIREAAIDAIARHPELGDAAVPPLVESLSSASPGLVAKAADVLRAQPALAGGRHKTDSRVAGAFRSAIDRPWSSDLVETRVALLDASAVLAIADALAFAQAAIARTRTSR